MVRHGQTPTTGKVLPGRAAGLHLAEAGLQQAHAVAERIAELPRVDAIYASPLERARETAAPIGKALQQRVKINKGLLECDFGDWTGEQLSTLMKNLSGQLCNEHLAVSVFPMVSRSPKCKHAWSQPSTTFARNTPVALWCAYRTQTPLRLP